MHLATRQCVACLEAVRMHAHETTGESDQQCTAQPNMLEVHLHADAVYMRLPPQNGAQRGTKRGTRLFIRAQAGCLLSHTSATACQTEGRSKAAQALICSTKVALPMIQTHVLIPNPSHLRHPSSGRPQRVIFSAQAPPP